MKKYPVKQQDQVPGKSVQDGGEFMLPSSFAQFPKGNSFMSFHYSYSEISSIGDKAFMKSKKASFENGKLTSESFEGTMERNAYDQVIAQAQLQMQSQTSLFLKSLSLLLPFRNRGRPKQD